MNNCINKNIYFLSLCVSPFFHKSKMKQKIIMLVEERESLDLDISIDT